MHDITGWFGGWLLTFQHRLQNITPAESEPPLPFRDRGRGLGATFQSRPPMGGVTTEEPE
ncbi:MAG: hypothetical protein NT023_15425 [Armatimonadetes bacterium]|nr:hypothetical protein [Armatimonadota bacterium]